MFVILRRFYTTKSSKMVRVLNVAEKNDAAKSISDIMSRGGFRKREGLSKFNKIYEFDYNILNQNCTMSMTSVSGHLLGYEFVGAYRSWNGCNPVTLFDAPLHKSCPENYLAIKKTLEREIRGCQSLIIWTDCDREGENIGFEIVQVCVAVKPNLQIYRARFSEITPQAVQNAVRNLVPPHKNTSDAVDVRQQLDLRIGAAFTRFQTLRLKQVFPDVLADRLISYGSCQFPTLGFVVERYKQVQAFIPEAFWKIKVTHQTDDGLVDFLWKRGRLYDHLACLVLYQQCLEAPDAKVLDVRSKPKSKWRPVALDTVEMEKLSSRKLRITAKETMKIAEKLYTQGYISYPRTETNIFPKDLDLANYVQQQTSSNAWGDFAANILQTGGPTPRNGNKSDKAHPPIHPIKFTDSLQGNEWKVYEFIVRHFLACCSQDAQGQETIVDIEINAELFSASGLMIIARNYLDVYPYDKWNAKVIPVYHAGDSFRPTSLDMNEGETSPPSLLAEADLIALMDKHGIGTDATHAEHIETIKSRLYVGVRDDGRFVPGELGMGLVEGYDSMGFHMSKPNLRAELENDLKLICEGQKDMEDVLVEQIRKYREVFIEASEQANKIDVALSEYFGNAKTYVASEAASNIVPVRKCPACGTADMVIRSKKTGNGLFASCMGYPNCKNAIWFPDFVLEAKVSESVCERCQPGPVRKIHFKFKRGSMPAYIPAEYEGCIGGCDTDLNEMLQISSHSRPINTQGSGGRQTGGTSRHMSDSGYGSSTQSQYRTQGQAPTTARKTQGAKVTKTQNRPLSTGTGRHPLSQVNAHNAPPVAGGFGGDSRGETTRVPPTRPDGGDNNDVVCSCGQAARMQTVRKEGANKGRQFYTCPKNQDDGGRCDFFLWTDPGDPVQSGAAPTGGGAGRGAGGGLSRGGASNWGRADPAPRNIGGASGDQGGCCGCGEPSVLRTVAKEGNNKGRQFHACPKGQSSGCNFFQWVDEDATPAAPKGGQGRGAGRGAGHGAGLGAGRGAGRGGSVSSRGRGASSGTARKRTCKSCGVEGHDKRNCPQTR